MFVIGGTNGETAIVRYNDDSTISIIDYQALPSLTKFMTVDDFLSHIDHHVDSIINAIGINFAFTLKPEISDHVQLDGI